MRFEQTKERQMFQGRENVVKPVVGKPEPPKLDWSNGERGSLATGRPISPYSNLGGWPSLVLREG